MADIKTTKTDPVRDRYFVPLEQAEMWSEVIFYVAGVLSIVVLLVDKSQYSRFYALAQIGFLLCAVAGFILALAIRLYWGPRAQDRRAEDFLSTALDARLIHERTSGYYNNEETDWIRKIGLQLLENSLFSKEITIRMCKGERIRFFVYLTFWLVAIFNRNTPIDLIVGGSQVLFTEQLLSRWFRVEWLRMRFEKVHNFLYKTFQAKPDNDALKATVLNELVMYESTKAHGGITLSSKIFEQINPQLSTKWEKIKGDLGL
jgi:hypothetical protein